ncbi:MAG: HAD hydrolase family protein [bacterium]|nr:HAD hydrolase family protein [bacterium]
MHNSDDYEKTKAVLNDNLKDSFIEYKFPKIKIINKKCNKLNAIDIIKNIEKIEDEKIYTIGDDINDIQMILKYHGYSLTTANEVVKNVSTKLYKELNELIADINIKSN